MKVMKDCGLRLLLVGYETGNREMLKRMKKGVTLEQGEEFARNCKKLGIMTHGAFVMGLPGETPETVEETIRFACKVDPDTIQVSLASPYPGTEMYEWCKKNGYLVENNLVSGSGYQKCSVNYPEMSSEEIYNSLAKFYRRFYFRPRFMAKTVWKMMRDWEEMKRRLREGYQFFQFIARRNKAGTGETC
jgi:radical SAM superfamily enzyme YgiQ (UPF0313 family)